MTRHQARENAFILLYAHEFLKETPMEQLYETMAEDEDTSFEKDPFILKTAQGVEEKEAELLSLIENYAQGWKINRISKVSLVILKLCSYEMLYTEVPLRVALNEAIELCKIFDEENAKAFVNGILNSIFGIAREKRGE